MNTVCIGVLFPLPKTGSFYSTLKTPPVGVENLVSPPRGIFPLTDDLTGFSYILIEKKQTETLFACQSKVKKRTNKLIYT